MERIKRNKPVRRRTEIEEHMINRVLAYNNYLQRCHLVGKSVDKLLGLIPPLDRPFFEDELRKSNK